MITVQLPPSGTFGAFKPQIPKEKSYLPYAVVIIFIIILAAGYYFFVYQNVGLSLKAPILEVAPPLTDLEVKIIALQNFSFDIIDGDFYKLLRNYGALPVAVDSLGRTNPFIPY